MSAVSYDDVVEVLVEPAPDPLGLDATRPVDIDTCGACMGDGGIETYLGDGEFQADECWSCGGTGARGAA